MARVAVSNGLPNDSFRLQLSEVEGTDPSEAPTFAIGIPWAAA